MDISNNIENFFHTTTSPLFFYKKYAHYLAQLLEKFPYESLQMMTHKILEARDNGRNIFFIGNGGSAATASHFANDIAIGTREYKKPFKVISLTDNVPIITAIGNDDGYDQIFSKQLEILAIRGDLLILISASGNSKNLIKAIEIAKLKKLFTIGLLGFNGGQLKDLCDLSLVVETPQGEYGPVEDIHMIFDHMIGSYLKYFVLGHK